MPTKQTPNEMSSKWWGPCGLQPFPGHVSSSRLQMFASHLGQMLVLNGSTERSIQTGMEREYGKYTFKVEMPCNGLILDIIERYPTTMGIDTIQHNPLTVVIYENVDTKEVGIINLVDYCSNHQYFGFRFAKKKGLNLLRIGGTVPKGTIFLDSPSITDEGGYKYGVQANVAYMTHPAASEDGILVSDSFLPKLGFNKYENRVVEWGKKKFALNLYGDATNYKPFPDIGDVIRADGVLMALRSYDQPELAIVEQGITSTQEIDYNFDTTIYADGAGGRVIDIRVHHDLADTNYAESHMDSQAQKYDGARRQFHNKILSAWKKLKYMRGESLQITPEFHQMVVQAEAVISEGGKQRVFKLYRKAPLDTYRVEFVIEYPVKPDIGFKLTDTTGGKGVFCQIVKEEDMPIDSDGNRADVVFDPNATINRSNPARLYEQYLNASSRDIHKRLCFEMGITPFTREKKALAHINTLPADTITSVYNYLLGYYAICSPVMRNWFSDGQVTDSPSEYLAQIVERGIGLHIPTDNAPNTPDIIVAISNVNESGITSLTAPYNPVNKGIAAGYRPLYGPVSYVGNSGIRCTTVKPIRVASVYMILLEKIGDDWSAVSSGKFQHFGVLAPLTREDKYSKPARNQAVRGMGEAEVRIVVSYVGPMFLAEMMDRNNNPVTHKAMVEALLDSDEPGNIVNLVDRKKIPFGGAKPLQILKHLCSVSGFSFKYVPYKNVNYQQMKSN